MQQIWFWPCNTKMRSAQCFFGRATTMRSICTRQWWCRKNFAHARFYGIIKLSSLFFSSTADPIIIIKERKKWNWPSYFPWKFTYSQRLVIIKRHHHFCRATQKCASRICEQRMRLNNLWTPAIYLERSFSVCRFLRYAISKGSD